MSSPDQNFRYFINVKRTVLVVSFVGRMTESDQATLNNCVNEIRDQKTVKFLIFNMVGLSGVDQACIRALAIIQGALREQFKYMLCSLGGETKKALESAGVIRDSEVHKDLLTALQVIIKMENQR